MRPVATLSLLVALAAAEGDLPCGFYIAPCPTSYSCSNLDASCTGPNCAGRCVRTDMLSATSLPDPVPTDDGDGDGDGGSTPTYAPCGGDREDGPLECEEGFKCVDDPRKEGCGMACDDTGICVPKGLEMCGGFAGFPCEEEGRVCIDDPFDDCDPENGGADCAGICV